jgi:hypothetical protein
LGKHLDTGSKWKRRKERKKKDKKKEGKQL